MGSQQNGDQVDRRFVQLSPRQCEVLIWTAQGKTTWETSVIMKCTAATVNYHLKQVFRKLDASNKTHAVSRAMSLGLITNHRQ
jgi:DNA-binding CsgD family transcriptional regulator